MRMKHCASTVIVSLLYIFFISLIFFYFTLLQLTTDLYASAVRGNVPLLNDCNRKVFGYIGPISL
jgi:hypothetical protein